MDNQELNLAIPETRTESLAGEEGIDAEEEDESETEETLEYVTFAIAAVSRIMCRLSVVSYTLPS